MATNDLPAPLPAPDRFDPLPHLTAETLVTLSHELRTPLAAIKGFTATLLRHDRRLSPDERHDFLAEIDTASARLGEVIDQLLQLTQLARTPHIQRLPVDVAQIALEAVTNARARWHERHTFQLEAQGKTSQTQVEGDVQLLERVITHLLDNAAQYTPQPSDIRVDVRFQPAIASPEGIISPAVVVRVTDQGIGIPPADVAHIFEPFYRVDQRLTREVDGLGLGLAYCARIVALHNGAIWATSAPGQGTTMTIALTAHLA